MAKTGLKKWFAEDWRDISTKDKSGKHPKCGRPSGSKRAYPKCVPAKKSGFDDRRTEENRHRAETSQQPRPG